MKQKILLSVACLTLLACGDSPTSPSRPIIPTDPAATTRLGLLVVGNTSGPVANATVRLQLEPGAAVSPGTSSLESVTNSDGVVEWRVLAGHRYGFVVNGQFTMSPSLVQSDARWLMSLPTP